MLQHRAPHTERVKLSSVKVQEKQRHEHLLNEQMNICCHCYYLPLWIPQALKKIPLHRLQRTVNRSAFDLGHKTHNSQSAFCHIWSR